MKNVLKATVLICTILLSVGSVFAQTQFEAMKAFGEGPIVYYNVSGDPGSYDFEYTDYKLNVTFKNADDPRLFSVEVQWGRRNTKYCLDEPGHSVTILEGGVKHPKLKYLTRVKEDKRIVVIDDALYVLEKYKSADNFRIDYILKKKSKLKGFKAIKEAMNGPKVMKASNPQQKVKDYLKKEFAAQATALPKWKAANADYYSQLEKDKLTWNALIKDSDKQYAKLRNKHAIVKNKTPHTIYFTTGGGRTPYKILSGKFLKVDCELAQMYRSNSAGDKLTPLFRPAKYCGKTFTVTTW